MEYRFDVQQRTRKEARDLIRMMARHGNHYWDSEWGAFTTTQHIEKFLAHYGLTLAGLVETLRVKDARGNPFENLLGSSWTFSAGETGVATYTDSEGNEIVRMEESGSMSTSTTAALFEKATEDFEHALANMSYTEFLSASANGLASVEAYISQKAYQYNRRNSDGDLVDDKRHKVSFEDKIKVWVPRMTDKKLDLGGKNWAHFQRIKRIRDTEHTHSKTPALNITHRELCKLMNLFGTGIAGMLLDLYVLFEDTVPSKVVTYAYHPKVELIAVENEAR